MASGAEGRLKELGIVLPALPDPGGNYLPAKTVGNVMYLAGVISIRDGEVIAGTVGADRTLDEGYSAARACALIQLAVLKRHLGSLDDVKTIVTVNGYVNAIPGFAHPESVAKFVRLPERWRDYLRDPTAAHAAIAKLNPALNPEWMQFTRQRLNAGHFVAGDDPSGSQLGQMDPKRWTTMYDQLTEIGVIQNPFDPATAYTLQFIQPN